MTITTSHGDATLYYDGQSDPANPGWVLCYSNGIQDYLHEILAADDPDSPAEAEQEATEFLRREGLLNSVSGCL